MIQSPEKKIPASLNEIRDLLAEMPGGDAAAVASVIERENQLTKPQGSLGKLETLTQWLACWQGTSTPRLDHPRTAVFAGNHGVTAQGVSAFPPEVTVQMVANFRHGGACVNQLVGQIYGDLNVYELDLDNPTADMSQGPAMDDQRVSEALAFGMMAVEPGIDALALGEMGIGNTTAAAAICLALFGGEAQDWTGPGTGVAGDALNNKIRVVAQAVETNRAAMTDGLETLRCVGGLELAAICGAILAARLAKVPVLLDGFICTAAAACLHAMDPGLLDHCLVAHKSAEPGHERLCAVLGKEPLLNLGMRLGEGSAATLAFNILRSALACHTGMATFEEAAVAGKSEV